METKFRATPWRDGKELLQLRSDLFWKPGSKVEDRRAEAVDKILAWRVRCGEIPLMLESTADLVGAVVKDEQGEGGVRMEYAMAVARFATGISDTQTDLRRSRRSWLAPSTSLDLPTHLLEIRHRIVHRHLPTLSTLKLVAQEALDWLWQWYWWPLDHVFSSNAEESVEGHDAGSLGAIEAKEAAEKILKTYIRNRKLETKTQKPPLNTLDPESRAAATATSAYLSIAGPCARNTEILISVLVDELTLVPAPSDKKTKGSMSGAFVLWTPLLAHLSASLPSSFLERIAKRMFCVLNLPPREMADATENAIREAICEWLLHITSHAHTHLSGSEKFMECVLEMCFTQPTEWTLRLAESILEREGVRDHGFWWRLLEVARDEDMQVEGERAPGERASLISEINNMDVGEMEFSTSVSKQQGAAQRKQRGPWKKIGLWRSQPIGMVADGWQGYD
ncbi:Las1-domain-containing protein [Lojkania enalia]|uniref:Las1-domain-containing protein n=1 Tax=Lojkania enalia TaxID=147567 RepID=A0A9P4KAD3_9PLEO|nr:Las1-domain-containing protein [Didymosphaeria enalia]